jgi:hypothetical protein
MRYLRGKAKELTSIKLGIVINHKHDFPLKHVVVHKPATYPRYALVVLHLFELAGEQACGCGGGGHGFLPSCLPVQVYVCGRVAVEVGCGRVRGIGAARTRRVKLGSSVRKPLSTAKSEEGKIHASKGGVEA